MMLDRSCAHRSRSACASAESGGSGERVDGAPVARGGAPGGTVGCCVCAGVAVRATATTQETTSNTAVVDRTTFTGGMIADREWLSPRASPLLRRGFLISQRSLRSLRLLLHGRRGSANT